MILNLTVASLVLSQLSHSPAFAGASNRYHLPKLQYFKQISPLVFGYRSLLVEQSRFRQFTSSIIVSGAGACHQVDCSLSATDGTLQRCEVSDACRTTPMYPEGNSKCILDLYSGGPTTVNVIECAFYQLPYGLVTLGADTQMVVEGCCFSQLTPADVAILVMANAYYPGNVNVRIDTSSVYQCSSRYGVSYVRWSDKLTLGMSMTRDNLTYNVQNGGIDTAFMKIEAYSRTSTTSITQCWFMGTEAEALMYYATSTSGRADTTISNSFFYNSTLSGSTKALFVVAENTWTVDGCAFDEVTSGNANILLSFPIEQSSRIESVKELNCLISERYQNSFVPASFTIGKTVETSSLTKVAENIINIVPSFTMNEFLYKEYSDYCKIYTFPPTAFFTASNTWTPTPYVPTPTNPPYPITGGPTASNAITVNAVFAVVTSTGTGVIAFGAAALVFLCSKKCCIYNSRNKLKVDVI